MDGPQVKDGFTVIEVLVVVAIIGLLIALLIPAVQAARESARRTHCSNNFKQVALALHAFNTAKKSFPAGETFPFNKDVTPFYSPQYADAQYYWGWSVHILPFIEEQRLFENLDFTPPHSYRIPARNKAVAVTVLPIFLCPSDPQDKELVWTSGTTAAPQVARTNICGVVTHLEHWNHGGCPIEFPRNVPNNPGFDDICYGIFGANGRCKVSDILDGTSNTFLLAEVAGGGPGTYYGRSWITANLLTTFEGINGENSAIRNDYLENEDGPASFHPHGATFAMADGSVAFVSENTDQNVLNALSTRDGTGVDRVSVSGAP